MSWRSEQAYAHRRGRGISCDVCGTAPQRPDTVRVSSEVPYEIEGGEDGFVICDKCHQREIENYRTREINRLKNLDLNEAYTKSQITRGPP